MIGCNNKPDDQAIVQQVEARLFQDSSLKKCDIHVESSNGIVTVTGAVNAESDKAQVSKIVAQVTGVKQVIISLNVQPPVAADNALTPVVTPARPAEPVAVEPSPQSPPQSAPSVGPASVTTDQWTDPIDRYLSVKPRANLPSPMTGQGSMFESDGEQYTIDPRLIVAISGAETSFATGRCHQTPVTVTRNAWNWFWCYGNGSCGSDVCNNSAFDSWGSGIKTVSKYVERNYVMKGLTDVRKVQVKYCTEGCDSWVKNVTTFLEQMGGDPENLRVAQPVPEH